MHTQPRVDIVYLWVNGNDPSWRLKRQQAAAQLNTQSLDAMAVYSNVEGRFRDNEELRFSLRALERYFPQHGHVYIVTDGQTPHWLQASERLTLVDHRTLIPEAALPTFDSGHIESYIHHIAGLSERFFYLNDDVFFGAPVNLADWFWDGGLYVGWSNEPAVSQEPMRADATALENACRLSCQWLGEPPADSHYAHTYRTFAHSPRPLLRSMLYQLEGLAPDLFAMVRSTVFRVWDKPTIVSDFVLRWALAQGQAQVRDYTHVHVSTGAPEAAQQLDRLQVLLGTLDFFCINDTTDDAHPGDPRLAEVRGLLQTLFTQPSRFERGSHLLGVRPSRSLAFAFP
jgi:hypothetical protein